MSSNGPLYAMGGAHPNALDGFATGSRGNERPQEILTPQSIVDFVREVFGGPIAYDPCAAVDSQYEQRGFVQAQTYDCEPGELDGLESEWPDKTYCNPPYKDLKEWFAKAVEEQQRGTLPRIIVLAPVRTHRVWWRHARNCARADGFVLELNPVAFHGYKQTFPAPLALLGFNCEVSNQASFMGDCLGDFL